MMTTQSPQPSAADEVAGDSLPHYSEGVCFDGAAILRDGAMMPIEAIVSELNRLTVLSKSQLFAADEVAGVVADLKCAASACFNRGFSADARRYRRAADLLERLADRPAVPDGREPASVIAEPSDEELESVALTAEVHNMKEQGGLSASDANGVVAQLRIQRLAGLRAVAAHWGRSTPQPIPVSERLPEAGDCIHPTGECWWFDPAGDGGWYLDTYQGNYTHWLPAHALPLPSGEGE